MTLLALLPLSVALAADCPAGSEPLALDGAVPCARQEADTVVLVGSDGRDRESGVVEDGHRTGWWARLAPDGQPLGETRYEAGVAVEGLGAPATRPRCLAEPPPDGVYGLPDAVPCPAPGRCVDPMLLRPVAVVSGCVGATPSEAWSEGTAVVGRDRFAVVESDAARCPSGKTVEYRTTPDGLDARLQIWTRCGGATSRTGEPVALVRTEPVLPADATSLDEASDAVRAATLEAIGARQAEEWTCEPLGRAIRGSFDASSAARAIDLAVAPCLAPALRGALYDHLWSTAADALARVDTDPARLATDLVQVAAEGVVGAAGPLAERVAALGTGDDSLRDALGRVLLDRDGTPASRQEAVVALDRLYRAPEHGLALLDHADRGGSCSGWQALYGTVAVRATGTTVMPRRVTRRCADIFGLPPG